MTSYAPSPNASCFKKDYPSVAAADAALHRSVLARQAGVPTPAVLGRNGPLQLLFARVIAAEPPMLDKMVEALLLLNRMPPDGLSRFDPFLRIRPRLGTAPSHIRTLVTALETQDAALRLPASTVIHGDFHPGQTIRDRSGRLWLLDLDDLALAPPEADLGNLAAWIATKAEGNLVTQARTAIAKVLAQAPHAAPDLTGHFLQIALVRRALKLAEKGRPWALDQLRLRA
jgi:hypothetical protein